MIKWLWAIPAFVVILIVGLSIYLQPNSFLGCQSRPVEGSRGCDSADAIVVVSGGDTQARTAKGIELYENGWANALILSGAAQDTSGPSNAATMRTQALQAGVPADAIFIDEESRTTQQNAVNSQSIFQEHNFSDIILVTSNYHQRRANLEFEKFTGVAEIRNYPVADKDWGWFWWATPKGWWLAGGEFVKIIAFYFGASS